MRFLSAMWNFVFDLFFGCRHERQTRPFTLKNETYKVCLECGRHLFYSPETMRQLSPRELKQMRKARTLAIPSMTVDMPSTADGGISAA